MGVKPWHIKNSQAFEALRARVEVEFPYLHFGTDDGRTILTGELPIVTEGRILDRFEIKVILPPGGPRAGIPVVREIGGRLPHGPDRHIEQNGDACLFVKDEFWYRNPDGMDLIDFLHGPVYAFFVGQSLVELGHEWPYDERSHGANGIVEFYAEIIDTNDTARIRKFVEAIAAKKMRNHSKCPCGSGRRIRDCHRTLLEKLRDRIPRKSAKDTLEHFVH